MGRPRMRLSDRGIGQGNPDGVRRVVKNIPLN